MLPDSFGKYHISYEEAMKDTPQFRLGVSKFMEELEDTQKWFESMARGCRAYSEDFQKCHDSIVSLAKKLVLKSESVFIDASIAKTISESMMTVTNLELKAVIRNNVESRSIGQNIREIFPHKRNWVF
jgi:hypothetical protein